VLDTTWQSSSGSSPKKKPEGPPQGNRRDTVGLAEVLSYHPRYAGLAAYVLRGPNLSDLEWMPENAALTPPLLPPTEAELPTLITETEAVLTQRKTLEDAEAKFQASPDAILKAIEALTFTIQQLRTNLRANTTVFSGTPNFGPFDQLRTRLAAIRNSDGSG
jgi:hypothetical protein